MSIFLKGLGACREVGRSSFLLDFGEKILMDRGIKLSSEETEYPKPVKTNLDAIIISHAHLDHSGDLPPLFLESDSLCYMTQPTLAVAEVLWQDTLKIAGYEGVDAKFSKQEIERTKRYSFPLIYNKPLDITHKCSMQFFDAGHILGAALTRLDFSNKSFLYTGDFNPIETRLHEGADVKGVGEVDYVLCESTYGGKEHPPRKQVEKEFIAAIKETLENGGHAIVPAFAVGRSQEIVDLLLEAKINAPIYFDGMCQKISRIYLNYGEYLKSKNELSTALKNTEWIKSDRDRKKVLQKPSVIVATAGMLAGGPILHYIKQLYSDPNSSILLTGFQVKDTPGELLKSTGTIPIDEEEFKVDCKVHAFDFSAHADTAGMLSCFKQWNPEKILLCHGDPEAVDEFKQTIEEQTGIEAIALEAGKKVQLD